MGQGLSRSTALGKPFARGSSVLNLRTRDVCKDCNTVWMRELEEEATPLFLALSDTAKNNTQLVLQRHFVTLRFAGRGHSAATA
jgi:hypothetical protein